MLRSQRSSFIIQASRAFQLASNEQATGAQMTMQRYYDATLRALESEYQQLADFVAALPEGEISAWRLQRMERYRQLTAQIRAAGRATTPAAVPLVQAQITSGAALGAQQAGAMLTMLAQTPAPITTFSLGLPSVEQGQFLAGRLSYSSLSSILDSQWGLFGPALAEQMVKNQLLGRNPTDIVAYVRRVGQAAPRRAGLIARTEALNALRQTSQQHYGAGGVQQYRRLCRFSATTCIGCAALNGEIYDTLTEFYNHPNCRCVPVPIVPGARVQIPDFDRWLRTQDEDAQLKFFGPNRLELWQQGTPLSDMVLVRPNPIYGPTPTAKPLALLRQS